MKRLTTVVLNFVFIVTWNRPMFVAVCRLSKTLLTLQNNVNVCEHQRYRNVTVNGKF